jgi:transposase-like protein
MASVIDGSKALRAGVERVFGRQVEVQRCQIHKRRNVKEYLPENCHDCRWQFPGGSQGPSMEQNPDGNQNQSQNEQSGKNEKEQHAHIRVRGPRQHEVVEPEGYERDYATCCQNHTNQTDRVLAQIV